MQYEWFIVIEYADPHKRRNQLPFAFSCLSKIILNDVKRKLSSNSNVNIHMKQIWMQS